MTFEEFYVKWDEFLAKPESEKLKILPREIYKDIRGS
tara:strand:+ start:202 stop:312 length:111 start_codon:yes stop_codon:yes gene_type:complete